MAKEYYSLLTKVGQAKIANASLLGTKVNITTIKLGDGNGAEYNPTEEQTDLKRVVYSGNVSVVRKDPTQGNVIVIESVIPQSAGNFTIREIGYYDVDGDLILIAKYKSQFKPQISSNGAAVDMKVNTVIAVSNAENVELKIDNTLIFVTTKDLEKLRKEIMDKVGNLSSLKTNTKVNVVAAINEINEKAEKLKATYAEVTLEVAKWSGQNYSLEANYPTSTYDIEIELSGNATKDIAKVWGKVIPVPSPDGQNIIKALGTVPSINIPIRVKAVKK